MSDIYNEAEIIKKRVKENYKCKIALLGQPGAGKSSLINSIVGRHVTKINSSLYVAAEVQVIEEKEIVFFEFPSYFLTFYDNRISEYNLEQFDLFLYVFSVKIPQSDLIFLKHLIASGRECLLVRTKSDEIWDVKKGQSELEEEIRLYVHDQIGLTHKVFFVSNRTKNGLELLVDEIKKSYGLDKLARTYTMDFLDDRKRSCNKIISTYLGWGIANGFNPIPGLNSELDLEIFRNLFKEIRESFGLSNVILENVPSSLHPLSQKVLLDWFTRDWIFTQSKNVDGNEIVKNYSLLMPIVGQIWGAINGHKLVESLGKLYLSDCYELAEKILEEELTVLNINIDRLRIQLLNHQGNRKIAIIGQPGSGKSTMLDNITFFQLDPRPKAGQQTDATDWSQNLDVKLLDLYQNTIYVDVPGYNTITHPVESIVNHFPFDEFDIILFVVKGKVHEADNKVWASIKSKNMHKNTLVIRTFSDGLDPCEEGEVLDDFKKQFGQECLFVSNRSKKGFTNLMYFLNLHPSKIRKIMP